MRIVAFTAGAARMYCGSCLRDNALAAELKQQGPRRDPAAALHAHADRRGERQPAAGVSSAASASTSSSTRRSSAARRAARPAVGLAVGAQAGLPQLHCGESATARRDDGLDAARARTASSARRSRSCSTGCSGEPPPDVVTLPNSLLIGLAEPMRAARSDRPGRAARCRAKICFSSQLPGAVSHAGARADSRERRARRRLRRRQRVLRGVHVRRYLRHPRAQDARACRWASTWRDYDPAAASHARPFHRRLLRARGAGKGPARARRGVSAACGARLASAASTLRGGRAIWRRSIGGTCAASSGGMRGGGLGA